MTWTIPPPDEVLKGLKDFQRATVEHVFSRLYGEGASGRYLVADEVGLGKTLVARGVIAKTIERLKPTVPRIDVVYICSNSDIARRNINRLKVGGVAHVALSSRLTLLPREISRLNETTGKSGVNFISLTPQTSFQLGGTGLSDERVLLYWLLHEAWSFGNGMAPKNVFQCTSGPDRFRQQIAQFDPSGIDAKWKTDDFAAALERHPNLRPRFDALCAAYTHANRAVPQDVAQERYAFIGDLRAVLAASCVNALEPDLIILDEFQRFGDLLDGKDDASRLARELFTYRDVRVLLLSATPYKMYTLADDAAGEDHYADFLRTLRFLERAEATDPSLDQSVTAYRESLLDVGEGRGPAALTLATQRLEERLRRVMVRTERLASTPDRNGMLVEVPPPAMRIEPKDLHDYLSIQKVARSLEADDALELWKSAPFVLNFTDDGYKLKRQIIKAVEDAPGRARLAHTLGDATGALLPWAEAERYGAIEPGNARLRSLLADVVDRGAWKLLWVPPSQPYYRLEGVYGPPEVADFTKRLVFSSWRVVPRAVAGLVSYEVERRMLSGDEGAINTPEARKTRRGLLRFAVADERLTGMPVLALLYPSIYLARACDPAKLLAERARERALGDAPSSVETIPLEQVLAIARGQIEVGLARLGDPPTTGTVDERWYWVAPLLLDRALDTTATLAWFEQPDLAAAWSGEEKKKATADKPDEDEDTPEEPGVQRTAAGDDDGDAWQKHVEEARIIARSGAGATLGTTDAPLGRMPEDLVEVLAELAIAGPAVAMLRALDRVVNGESTLKPEERIALRNGAGRTAWSFRSLFNQPEVMAMLRGGARGVTETPYWRQVLRYSADGCLPAVLDEYVHVLRDHLGLMSGSIGDRVHEITDEIRDAVELRTSHVGLDELVVSQSGRTVNRQARRLRTHFALRFADGKSEDGTETTRADQVRKAFNSPFWPFVLVTTSVGQEGLDFHTYCHAVVHWNLPSNPVDLEQREGRVHRYKGHAIRKNVARAHGWVSLEADAADPWQEMFKRARACGETQGASEIVPFWVYPVEGGARIERHILSLPMSREHAQAARLRSSLAVYRMVFGQPRQEDLVAYLTARVPPEELERVMAQARIDLSPKALASPKTATEF